MLHLTTAMLAWWAALGGYTAEPGGFPPDADLEAASLQRYWQADLPLPPGDVAISATRLDDRLYVITRQGNVAALHAPTGLTLWIRSITTSAAPILRPTHLRVEDGPGPVVFVVDRSAHVLDQTTGQVLAELALPFPVGSSAVGDQETLYLGSSTGDMHAVKWDTAGQVGVIRLWQVRTGGPIRSGPVLDGDRLLFASTDGRVHSCRAYNKVRNWSLATGGPVLAALVLHQSGVYVASGDRSLYRLEPFSGTLTWRRRLPMPLRDDPVVAGGTVYQYSQQAGLFAVEIDSGRIRWHRADARFFGARHADRVFAATADLERLLALDDSTGKLGQSLDIAGARAVAANPHDDAIYLVSPVNRVVCLRPAEVPYLSRKELTAVQARLARGGNAAETQAPPPASKADQDESWLDDPLRSRRDITPVAGHK